MAFDRRISTLLLALGAVLLSGCEEENPLRLSAPNANDDILEQHYLGDPGNYSAVHQMVVDGEFRAYFCGWINGKNCVGRIDSDGTVAWVYDLQDGRGYGIALARFPTSSSEEAIILCGGVDPDGDGRSNRGFILILDKNGASLLHENIESEEHDIWLADFEVIAVNPSGILLFGVGGIRRSDILYPYMSSIQISSGGEMKSLVDTIFANHPQEYTCSVTWNRNLEQPKYFGIQSQYSGDTVEKCSVICVDDSLHALWQISPYPSGISRAFYGDVGYLNEAVLVAGENIIRRDDTDRWAGAVASLTESGEVNWTNTLPLSDFHDGYYNIFIAGGELFAVGLYSWTLQRSTNHAFGYGLLSKFDLANGKALFHKTFGDPTYRSEFWAISMAGNRVFCGGISKYYVHDYWYMGWLVEADCSEEATLLKPPPLEEITEPVSEPRLFLRKE